MILLPKFRRLILQDRILSILLVIAALIQGGIYLAVFPPWQAPDETSHFQAVEMWVRLGHFADWKDYGATPLSDEFVNSLQEHKFWQRREVSQPASEILTSRPTFRDLPEIGTPINAENYPRLYYSILTVFYRLAPQNITAQFYTLRATSVFLLAAIIFMSWQISRQLFPDDRLLAISVPVALIFLPMHISINSAITTDVLAEFFCTAVFTILIFGFKGKFSKIQIALVVLLLIGGISTKRTTLFMIPLVAGALIFYWLRRSDWSPLLKWGVVGTTVGLGGISIGLLTLLPFYLAVNVPQALDWLPGTFFFNLFGIGNNSNRFPFFSGENLELFRHSMWIANITFWGAFGWANVWLDITVLQMLQRVVYLIIIGVIIFVVRSLLGIGRKVNDFEPWQRDTLVVFFMAVVLVLIMVFTPPIIWQDEEFGPHARYTFPAIVPIIIYFLLGIRQLTPDFYGLKRYSPIIVCVFLFLLNLISLTIYIIPFYYG
jgi:hypothetical protein